MADLSVRYLGLKLKNPIVAASSGLCSTPEGVKRAFDAGVGAVVLKSLFEEQLKAELSSISPDQFAHPESEAFLAGMGMNEGADEYLKLIAAAKQGKGGPVIASVNCVGSGLWADFAKRIASAGADALELNVGYLPDDPSEAGSVIEDRIVALVSAVKSAVSLPVAVKIGASYTNPGNLLQRVGKAGAQAAVLFNRFYRMDVDLDGMSLSAGPMRSSPEAYHESLRWIALLEGRAGVELCASGGVYDGLAALKLVAAGAQAVQVCSAAYAKGYGAYAAIIEEMSNWMDSRRIASLSELRGRLARRNSDRPELYGRLHYVKALIGQG